MASTTRTEAIRRRAYELWEASGRPDGREGDHWLEAEREIGPEPGDDASGAGITNRPVERELQEQEQLPPRGEAKPGSSHDA